MENGIDVSQEECTCLKMVAVNGSDQTKQLDELHELRLLCNKSNTKEGILHKPPHSATSSQFKHGCLLKEERIEIISRNIACIGQPPWKSLWCQRPVWLQGFYFSNAGDRSLVETFANILTSMPFIFVGLHTPRKRLVTRLYADSVVGVGLASSLYHSSRGEIRNVLRWGDYVMIAAANLCLSRVLHKGKSNMLFLASATVLPFHPVGVATIHMGMNEVTLARKVLAEPRLRKAYGIHAISTLAGAALFLADDTHPDTPYIHAAWHLAAAFGAATINQLLE
ncbi:hypothetical protein O6H91_02G064800 [Diphasiastrum complanatum]|uniref:Uncharacterized protein n=1 Tax=Diphasiastrum complanatum TaxID=34168 RepID=A0ACC2EGP0_DIPCM|nr:hypothetical protein O6H91_02G064800 [Diphasiastrum complanatum]